MTRCAAKLLFVETAVTLLGTFLFGRWSQLETSLWLCGEDEQCLPLQEVLAMVKEGSTVASSCGV